MECAKILLLMQFVMEELRLGAQKKFEGLAVDEIQSLTAQETEHLEADRMNFNAFRESVRKFPFGWKVLISWGLSEKIRDKRAWRTVLF